MGNSEPREQQTKKSALRVLASARRPYHRRCRKIAIEVPTFVLALVESILLRDMGRCGQEIACFPENPANETRCFAFQCMCIKVGLP